MLFNYEQKIKLLQWLKELISDPYVRHKDNEPIPYEEFNRSRLDSIDPLTNLIESFVNHEIAAEDFIKEHGSLAKEYERWWGFSGRPGQLQLNWYSTEIPESDPLKDEMLRKALMYPLEEKEAEEKIDKFADYLSPFHKRNYKFWKFQTFMLSYFWEIQKRNLWCTYWLSAREALLDIPGLATKFDTAPPYGSKYIEYVDVIKSIWEYYNNEAAKELNEDEAKFVSKERNPLWLVERVLHRHFYENKLRITEPPTRQPEGGHDSNTGATGEYLPLIMNDLVDLSLNKETEWSKKNNRQPLKAFERKVGEGFKFLGYKVSELGQGTGREPDGIAESKGAHFGNYAVIYDTKARSDKYSIGTDDRAIIEYIYKKVDLDKKTYFTIISSDFDLEKVLVPINVIHQKTTVPITLLKAIDLLRIIELKLQNVKNDHTKLELLFKDTGLITRAKIDTILG